jgi:fibronectin type 3 domain-containing protein
MKLRFKLIILLLYGTLSGISQNIDTAYISVNTHIQKNAVLLRWAVSNPVAWMETNKYGFDIIRYTVVRDGNLLPEAEMMKLNQTPIKAKPLENWEKIAQNNDYAAIIVQALYGKDFEVLSGDVQGIAKIISMSQELEQRFAMSLYAADQNFEAACMAGWGWHDTDVKSNERYLYRIIPVLPDNNPLNIRVGAAFVDASEYKKLPHPIGLSGIFGNKSVMLVWDYSIFSDLYNSYYVEKSTDGHTFNRINVIPITNLNSKEDKLSDRIYFIDSLMNNTDKYYYRIIGITSFGETGPPSDAISGQGREILVYVPYINNAVINNAGDLEMEWEFDVRGNNLIKGFELSRSGKEDDDYTVIVRNISPEQRSLLLAGDKLITSNYFIITAIPHEGEPAKSFPVLVQLNDSIPPAIPTGLKGMIDTTGIVILSWNRNTEQDLLGYKVYRAQIKDEEAIPLFDVALKDTVYVDTINIHNLNRNIYYTIASLDLRYNQSDLATLLELEKPDVVSPSSPVISDYRIKDEGIEIIWINSSDPEVIQHRLWRSEKVEGYSRPVLLKTITDNMTVNYVDTSVIANKHYIYTVTALKSNFMESPPSNKLTAFTNKAVLQNMEIERFDAIVDKTNRLLKLTWHDHLKNVQYYELYKGESNKTGNNISLWKTVQNGQYEVTDESLISNTVYQYIIRAILKEGKNTKSKSLTIKY